MANTPDKRNPKPTPGKNSSSRGARSNQNAASSLSRDSRGNMGAVSSRHESKRRPKSSPSLASPARICAYEILSHMRNEGRYLSHVAPKVLREKKLSPEDKSFAILLSRGVVSTKGSLDELINSVLSSPKDVQDDVRDALRIGVYELFYLKKEAYVVADQTVELARYVAPRSARVANFAMRRLCEQAANFPYGNPETSLSAAAMKEGFPKWLAGSLESDMGADQARYFMSTANKQAPVYFTINCNRVEETKVKEAFEKNQIAYSEVIIPGAELAGAPSIYKLEVANSVSHPLFSGLVNEGAIILSDASAQHIAALALPESQPERFLEVGAGNGTKSLLLQNAALKKYGKQLALTSVEINESKVGVLRNRLTRSHVAFDSIVNMDGRLLTAEKQGTFDAIFIDAPCTGVGTLRRHPEIRWRLKESDSRDLAVINLGLLETAAKMVNPGGRLTYATCTPLTTENEAVVLKFLQSDLGKEYEVVPVGVGGEQFFRSPLDADIDIHFACVLKRK